MKIPFLRDGPERPSRMINASILRSSFERRAVVIGAVQGGIGVLLALRLGYLAVAENEKYRLESESNRVNLTLVPPRRGWILDRNGAPLASNRADFRVDLIPERLKDAEATIDQLGQLLALEPVRRRFAIGEDDFSRVERWLTDLQVHWGIDDTYRAAAPWNYPTGIEAGTWRIAIDRLINACCAAFPVRRAQMMGRVILPSRKSSPRFLPSSVALPS